MITPKDYSERTRDQLLIRIEQLEIALNEANDVIGQLEKRSNELANTHNTPAH